MASEYWFYFDLYASGLLVGRSRVFKIVGKDSRGQACAAAEEEWLASGALVGDAYELLAGVKLWLGGSVRRLLQTQSVPPSGEPAWKSTCERAAERGAAARRTVAGVKLSDYPYRDP